MPDYDSGLEQVQANHQPLTPLLFLERAAAVFPDHTAVIHGALRRPYRELRDRCVRLADALRRRGLGRGDTVAAILPNTPAMLECHYGVPMAGAVLCALNVRLDAGTIAYALDHGEAKLVIVDREYVPLLRDALALAGRRPEIVEVDDPEASAEARANTLGAIGYEDFLAGGDPGFAWPMPPDEWDAIALNYTSGTTGRPKGVVYHHRGAQLLATGNVLSAEMMHHPVYLWTLPMFHCNGWCFPWTVCALAGTHVCLRQVRAEAIWDAIGRHGVTHLCGAPIVMLTLLGLPEAARPARTAPLHFLTAGAPPPEAVLAAMREAGIRVTHIYGLTEVYGPVLVNEWHREWDALPAQKQAALMARQGVRYLALEGLAVMDPASMQEVPNDGTALGEVMLRGNAVMKGYLKDPQATAAAFRGGWFHTGDLAVRHPDGYVQLRDRAKDIIISGGENISSIEVEDALFRHPAVAMAAVVAQPDEKWGETPCAFVELRPGMAATEAELIGFARDQLAHYKAPRRIVFAPIPKTSTGKVQKNALRERVRQGGDGEGAPALAGS